MIDLGAQYYFNRHPGQQLLLCCGYSVAGQTENYAYVGVYWTWGKSGTEPDSGDA